MKRMMTRVEKLDDILSVIFIKMKKMCQMCKPSIQLSINEITFSKSVAVSLSCLGRLFRLQLPNLEQQLPALKQQIGFLHAKHLHLRTFHLRCAPSSLRRCLPSSLTQSSTGQTAAAVLRLVAGYWLAHWFLR